MRIGFAVTLALLATGPAAAADKEEERASASFNEVAKCRAIADRDERLACFDRTVGAFVAARDKGEVVVIDKERIVERKKRRFGLGLDMEEMFGGGREDVATEVRELESTIRRVEPASVGLWVIQLDNGMVWQTTQPLRFTPKAGQTAKLTAALMGGYRIAINGRNSILAKRVR